MLTSARAGRMQFKAFAERAETNLPSLTWKTLKRYTGDK